MVYRVRFFFSSKCSLFHNSNVFGSCFIHILYTADLNIPYVSEVIKERTDKHLNKLQSHPNPLVETLTQPTRNRRLKRRWTSDLHD